MRDERIKLKPVGYNKGLGLLFLFRNCVTKYMQSSMSSL